MTWRVCSRWIDDHHTWLFVFTKGGKKNISSYVASVELLALKDVGADELMTEVLSNKRQDLCFQQK